MKTSPRKGGRGLRGKLATVLYCLSLALMAGPCLNGQTLSGWLYEIPHTAYASQSSQFRLEQATVNGSPYQGGSVSLFCADLPGTSIDADITTYPHYISSFTLGTLEQMTIWTRFSNTQNEALAISMAHWVVDNYYMSYFLEPANNASDRQYAFQNVLWEVFGDGGTSAGLSFSTGNITRSKFGPGGSNDAPQLWAYMTQMLNGVKNSGVTTAYQPQLKVVAVHDSRTSYQDYLLVPRDPSYMLVPEPSVGGLLALTAGLLWRRRK